MKKIIVLGGANGGWNLGDDAMFEALVIALRKEFDCKIITDSERMDWTSDLVDEIIPYANKKNGTGKIRTIKFYLRYLFTPLASILYRRLGIKSPSNILNKYMRAMKHSDALIIAGMGAVNDKFALHGIWGNGLVIRIAHAMKKPIIMSGNGIGPITKKRNRFAMSRYINHIDRIFVRDSINSINELRNLGYKGKIYNTIDDSFFLRPEKSDVLYAKSLLKELGLKEDKFIAINIHRWDNIDEKMLIQTITEIIKKYPKEKFVLLPNYFQNNHNDDRIILTSLIKHLKIEGIRNVTIINEILTAKKCLAILKMSKFSIATRYHVGVFTLSMGKPTILLCLDNDYYVQKMQGALKHYDLEKFCIQLNEFKDLDSKIKMILSQINNISADIIRRNKDIEKKGFESVKYIKEVLDDNK